MATRSSPPPSTGDLLKTQLLPLPAGMKDAPEKIAGEHHQYTIPLTAIVQPAIPFPAAALPHDAGSALALDLLSVRDFLPRPGYILLHPRQTTAADLHNVTNAAVTKPSATSPADAAWRVDLMHCGTVIESYWFSDDRRLLCIQEQAHAPVISHRVASEAAATAPPETMPASTQPQTRPAPGGIN